MSSNVGGPSTYEAGDQRNKSEEEKKEEQPDRFEEGKSAKGAHDATDSKDERSIANRLEKESKKDDDPSASGKATEDDKLVQEDPTALARSHGNEPSKGAKIDAQIQAEEEALIAKMDAKKGK